MPTDFAKSATRLTAIDIETPEGISKDSVMFYLAKDKRGKDRTDTAEFVTYGAVEYDSTFRTRGNNFYILIFPSPIEKDFFVIFENDKEQKISVELFDVEGKKF